MILSKPMLVNDSREVIIRTPKDIVSILYDFYSDLTERENFSVIALDGGHKVISIRVIAVGTINRTLIHPREIFRNAIIDNSAAIILCHNHPSGNPNPSSEDIETTEALKDAGQLVGIEVLDHVIIGDTYYSFCEHELIFDK